MIRDTVVLLCFCLAYGNVEHAIGAEPLRGKALRPGDTIMLVAPARTPVKAKVMLGKQRLEAMGFRVRVPQDLFQKQGYLAGTDERRAREIMTAFADPEVDAIFAATGGFGTTRMLDMLDYDVIRNNPKIFTGFSDITGLHLAINKKTQLITFHSPNLDSGLGVEKNLTALSAHWFFRALTGEGKNETSGLPQVAPNVDAVGYTIRPFGFYANNTNFDLDQFTQTCKLPAPQSLAPGKARGRIVGGNLSLVTALMGTPYEIDTKNAVLFLEDIGEAPYRVDRMLSTLKLAGKLDDAVAIVLGTFTHRYDQDTSNEGQSTVDVLKSYFAGIGKPVIMGFPSGHHPCNATLPIGAECELDAGATTIRIIEEPVLVAR